MKFILKNEKTKQQTMIIERNVWTGKTSIIVDDIPAIKVAKLTYEYIDIDEKRIQVKIQGNDISGLEVVIDGEIIQLNKKLSKAELFFVFIPTVSTLIFMLIFGGNAIIGGLAGCIGFLFSFLTSTLIREVNNVFLKLMLSIAISG